MPSAKTITRVSSFESGADGINLKGWVIKDGDSSATARVEFGSVIKWGEAEAENARRKSKATNLSGWESIASTRR